MTDEKPAKRPPIGPVERRHRAALRKLGFTATSADALATDGVLVIDLAKTIDRTRAARDKAALSRELRILMDRARAAAAPAKGDAVDQAADEQPGGSAGAADPDREPDSVVRPFGRRRPAAG